jgi:tetratricopeptide (TPR) repeat protein
MKYLILIVFGAGILSGSAFYLNRSKALVTTVQPAAADDATPSATDESQPTNPTASLEQPPRPAPRQGTTQSLPFSAPLDKIALGQAVDLLVSSQASYEQKRATWKQLRERGCLDQAIAELEQRRADNPASPDYAAVLGHAYLQKCGTISDVREQGILAMQADKLFDSALSLDPANWEARFTKAVALSYWPASMGKGDEVIQHFTTLIQQQETQPQQPQFAEPYVWLGDQYQKAGRADDARSVWERGSGLFPSNQQFKNKLASLQ